jgi:hypothetical protein
MLTINSERHRVGWLEAISILVYHRLPFEEGGTEDRLLSYIQFAYYTTNGREDYDYQCGSILRGIKNEQTQKNRDGAGFGDEQDFVFLD